MLDTEARLPSTSQLASTARDVPVLVAIGSAAPAADVARLTDLGCEVLACPGGDRSQRLDFLLADLGRRRMTNVLVEGGGEVLGSLLDLGQIDEVHAFVATSLFGGSGAPGPLAGRGIDKIGDCAKLEEIETRAVGPDFYLTGRVRRGRE